MERTADLQEHLTHPAAADDALSALGALAAEWHRRRFVAPTAAQRLAWPAIAAGRHLLLSAPTGAGKTLAAFLPILRRLRNPARLLMPHPFVVSISPLSRRSLTTFFAIFPIVSTAYPNCCPKGRRCRDSPSAPATRRDPKRQALRHDPPEVLLTTPESLAVLLSQAALHPVFAGLRWVVVDEIHALAPTKRGADLALSLERLAALASEPLQRIGLSATAAPLGEAVRFLTGMDRPCAIAEVREETPLDLRIVPLADGPAFIPDLVRRLVPEVRACRAVLIFTNTRRLAERLAWVLRQRLPDWDDQIAVHHSSVAADRRREVEARFKQGRLRVVVSSTSLELGIDVGSVDLAALVHPPGGVVRLLQRLGRSGHGPGRTRRGLVFTSSAAELLEAVVTGASGRSAQCEPLHVPAHPLDVLCQQLAGMASAGTWTPDEAFAPVRRSYPYRDLSRKDFDACLAYLHGLDPDGRPWLPPRLRGDAGAFAIRDERTARLLRRNLGTILAEERVAVLASFSRDPEGSADPSWLEIGDVDQAFADRLQPGDRFLLDGRCLEFRRREGEMVFVQEVPGRPATPRWAATAGPCPRSWRGGFSSCAGRRPTPCATGRQRWPRCCGRDYGLDDEASALLLDYFQRQECISEIPDAVSLLIEEVVCDQGADYYLHTPLNRKGNDALARVAVHRLAPRPGPRRGGSGGRSGVRPAPARRRGRPTGGGAIGPGRDPDRRRPGRGAGGRAGPAATIRADGADRADAAAQPAGPWAKGWRPGLGRTAAVRSGAGARCGFRAAAAGGAGNSRATCATWRRRGVTPRSWRDGRFDAGGCRGRRRSRRVGRRRRTGRPNRWRRLRRCCGSCTRPSRAMPAADRMTSWPRNAPRLPRTSSRTAIRRRTSRLRRSGASLVKSPNASTRTKSSFSALTPTESRTWRATSI